MMERVDAGLSSVEVRRGVVPQVSDADADQLRESLQQWETMLDEAVLPEGIEEEVRAQLAAIYDLLGQVEVLGYGPVVKEVESLFGKGVRLAKYVDDAKKLAGCVTGLFAFLTHLSVNDWGEATNVLVGAFQMMGEALDIAHQKQHTMKAIESKQQPALEAKPADAEDYVEVVDEREPGDGHRDDERTGR
jgi:hypothetical protein